MSDPFAISCGLKQGAVYSPALLFAIFFNFVTAAAEREFDTKKSGINLRQDTKALKGATVVQVQNADGSFFTITSLEYADDVELNATSIKDLQDMVKIFGDMCAAFGMRISTKKAVVMAVEHGRLLNRRKERGRRRGRRRRRRRRGHRRAGVRPPSS